MSMNIARSAKPSACLPPTDETGGGANRPVRERPILFSAPMVRAILDGRKTQTRRIVKPSPGLQRTWLTVEGLSQSPRAKMALTSEGVLGAQFAHSKAGTIYGGVEIGEWSPLGWVKCPFGEPGDRLWVRETWACHFATDDQRPGDIDPTLWSVRYAADGHIRPATSDGSKALPEQFTKTRVSIHMPRWASRITLEITEVRVERLQEVSEADARAEGAMFHDGRPNGHHGWRHDFKDVHADARSSFSRLWREINGSDSWDANPWVWVVAFRRLAPPPVSSFGEGLVPTEPNPKGAQ